MHVRVAKIGRHGVTGLLRLDPMCDAGIIGTCIDLIISRLRLDLGVTPEPSLQSHREREARIISLPGLDLHVTPE